MSAPRPVTRRTFPTFAGGGVALIVSAVIGVVGLALFFVGMGADKRQAYHSYLAAFVFVTSIPIGALIFLCIGHAMGAKWVVPVRRISEAIVAAFPVLALLFIPIILGLKQLYPWVHGAAFRTAEMSNPHFEHLMHKKAAYLNETGFIVRGFGYFLAWIIIAEVLRRWSFKQDRDPGSVTLFHSRAVSAPALPIIAFALSFAAFDWMMSLAPTWFSAAFGLYWFAGGFMAAMAVIIICAAQAEKNVLRDALKPAHFHALGRLLFAFVIVWAYIAYTQGFITWIANKPEEVTWYIARVRGSWGVWGVVIIVSHFALPFLILLNKDLKKKPRLIAGMGLWLLIAHYFDMYWLVMPALHPGFSFHWLDIACLAGVGGITVAFALLRFRGRALVPIGDPRLEIGLRYSST